tara:strand:- start:36 stop:269 length:234 start_codon:yes stop_codon:yes gene_type:complete
MSVTTETRRQWCVRQLNDKDFMRQVGLSMPALAQKAGVKHRWMIHLKNQTRVHVDSDLVDALYIEIKGLEKGVVTPV